MTITLKHLARLMRKRDKCLSSIVASSVDAARRRAILRFRSLTASINYRSADERPTESAEDRGRRRGRRRRRHRCCVRGLPNARGHRDKFRPAESYLSHDPVARLHYPDAYNALLAPTFLPPPRGRLTSEDIVGRGPKYSAAYARVRPSLK